MIIDFSQYSDIALLLLRIVIAVIFLYHAFPKLKKAKAMSKGMGMPAGVVSLLGVMELLGALSVLTGMYMSLGALVLALIMLGATFMKISKWKVPFAAMDKTGWEFDLILFAAAIVLMTIA